SGVRTFLLASSFRTKTSGRPACCDQSILAGWAARAGRARCGDITARGAAHFHGAGAPPPALGLKAAARERSARADAASALAAGALLLSAVCLLRNLVLLELLVEIAARRVDDLGGLRDIPAVLAQLGNEIRALRAVLELAQGARSRGIGPWRGTQGG